MFTYWLTYFIKVVQQISANQGPNLKLVLEANIKVLMSKSNSSQVIKLMVRGRVSQPQGKY